MKTGRDFFLAGLLFMACNLEINQPTQKIASTQTPLAPRLASFTNVSNSPALMWNSTLLHQEGGLEIPIQQRGTPFKCLVAG